MATTNHVTFMNHTDIGLSQFQNTFQVYGALENDSFDIFGLFFFTDVFKNNSSDGVIHLSWEEVNLSVFFFYLVFFSRHPTYKKIKRAMLE